MDYQEEKAERGKRFAQWLREASKDLRTGEPMKPASISRLTGVSPTRISVLLNNCFDKHDNLFKLPRAATIDKLAEKLGADANEAKAIVGLIPRQSAAGVFIPDPNSKKFVLTTGDIIFSRPGDPDADRRARLVEAYLVGIQDASEK